MTWRLVLYLIDIGSAFSDWYCRNISCRHAVWVWMWILEGVVVRSGCCHNWLLWISKRDTTGGSSRLCFYQTRLAWSVDQGSNKNHSPVYNFAPTVTKFCVVWEGLSLPHDTKFGNCRCEIVDSRAFPSWSLIHGLCWSGLIKAEPAYPSRSWE